MDPRELEVLAKRLGDNGNDSEALNAAFAYGQSDPRAYAVFLEKAGALSADPAMAAHWFSEAANVWTASMNDVHRAERALVRAVDTDPLNAIATDRLVTLYMEKGNAKGVAALHLRRAKTAEKWLPSRPELNEQVAAIYSELARVLMGDLATPEKAIEAYRKAAEHNPADAYAIYQVRELLKAAGRFKEALPWFSAEQALIPDDVERRTALYADEADVCRQAGETEQLLRALRGARQLDRTDDPGLKQQLAASILELVQAGKRRPESDVREAAALFLELAETYDGEHGHAYSLCALSLEPGNDRGAQLAMYYAEQIGRSADTALVAAAYLKANPEGIVANEARNLVATALGAGGDDSLLEALKPARDASPEAKARAFSMIARAMASQNRETEASKYYAETVLVLPADDEAVSYLAATLRGNNDGSLKNLLSKAAAVDSASLDQRHAWLSEVAELCEGPLRDPSGAIEARRQLVLLDPSDEDAADHLEASLEKAQKWADLVELLERRAEVASDSQTQIDRLLKAAALHRDRLKDPTAAGAALAQVALLDPDDQGRVFEAVDLFVAGAAVDKACELLFGLLGEMLSDDARPNYSRRLGQLLEGAGRHVDAGAAYAEAAAGLDDAELWHLAQKAFAKGAAFEQAARAAAQRRALVVDLLVKADICVEEADYQERMGDGEGAIVCLREALEHVPSHQPVGSRLEAIYLKQDRHGDLVGLLLGRASAISSADQRLALRKRAAYLLRDELADTEGMRQALLDALEDGDDAEVLRVLADDAEKQGQNTATVDFLQRLGAVLGEEGRSEVALRLATLLEEEGDETGALGHYREALAIAPDDLKVLSAVAQLERSTGETEASAASYEKLLQLATGDQKLATARCLADLFTELERPEKARAAYKAVLSLDPDDMDAVANLADLSESAGLWEDFVKYHAQLVDLEGDDQEAARMALRQANVLAIELSRPVDAMAALVPFARAGDSTCREEYERLGDSLDRQGEVAESLLEWSKDAPAGPKRNQMLRGAYARFLHAKANPRAIEVGLELVTMKGASDELARTLEEVARTVGHIEALQAAFVVLGRDLSGPPRASEMVRQAEVLAASGLGADEAVQHGEQSLTSVEPGDVESLLARLAELSGGGASAIDVYERQVTRCKSSEDRVAALCRAAEISAEAGAFDRVMRFFELAVQSSGQEAGLDDLRVRVRLADAQSGSTVLTEALCTVLSEAGKGGRDGGRGRAAYLARAAKVAYEDLKNPSKAFAWLGEALVVHTDELELQQLVEMGDAEGDLKRVVEIIGEALGKVHDGPLVRLLLRTRLQLRSERTGDDEGAGHDLKKLYDLSPSDSDIAAQLEGRYRASGDDRGLVQLYEDQILRGRDQNARAELARKVALLWQDTLDEPREAADAWRRVLRMNSGDNAAKEGLERAKQAMRRVSPKEVAESEEKARREVESRREEEAKATELRALELEKKGEELKARHSSPPATPSVSPASERDIKTEVDATVPSTSPPSSPSVSPVSERDIKTEVDFILPKDRFVSGDETPATGAVADRAAEAPSLILPSEHGPSAANPSFDRPDSSAKSVVLLDDSGLVKGPGPAVERPPPRRMEGPKAILEPTSKSLDEDVTEKATFSLDEVLSDGEGSAEAESDEPRTERISSSAMFGGSSAQDDDAEAEDVGDEVEDDGDQQSASAPAARASSLPPPLPPAVSSHPPRSRSVPPGPPPSSGSRPPPAPLGARPLPPPTSKMPPLPPPGISAGRVPPPPGAAVRPMTPPPPPVSAVSVRPTEGATLPPMSKIPPPPPAAKRPADPSNIVAGGRAPLPPPPAAKKPPPPPVRR